MIKNLIKNLIKIFVKALYKLYDITSHSDAASTVLHHSLGSLGQTAWIIPIIQVINKKLNNNDFILFFVC